MSLVTRNPFKLYVSISSALTETSDFMKQHVGYPVDNVIQIKLSKESFVRLFKDNLMNTTSVNVAQRYNCPDLLDRLRDFFDSVQLSNHNNLASDITILVNNTYNDVDVNPVTLEKACAKDGAIFKYYFESNASYDGSEIITDGGLEYGTTSVSPASLKVYEVMGREIDNMISRNLVSTSEDQSSTSTSGLSPDIQYDDLDALYTIANNQFWANVKEGDSLFIEGSFNVPTSQATQSFESNARDGTSTSYNPVGSANLPIILQFVYSSNQSYSFPAAV